MISQVILGLGLAACVVFLVVLVTDCRYFGKRLTYWIYNRWGTAIFSARSEATRWRQLADTLQLQGDERVLDVGTAVGDLPLSVAALPHFRGSIVGVDWSPQMMAAARKEADRRDLNGRTGFIVVDARRPLPFANHRFDIVICLGLLETLPRSEQILSDFLRLLKPDGKVAFSLYRGWSAFGPALSLNWYQQRLTPSGFKLEVLKLRRNYDIVVGQKNVEI